MTDGQKDMVTCLKGDNGKILAKQKEVGEPSGVTTDTAGNIYVCISKKHERRS